MTFYMMKCMRETYPKLFVDIFYIVIITVNMIVVNSHEPH